MQIKQDRGWQAVWEGTDQPGASRGQSPAHDAALLQPFPPESPLEGPGRGAEAPHGEEIHLRKKTENSMRAYFSLINETAFGLQL